MEQKVKKNGCHNRPPFKDEYFSTGGTKPIPHVLSRYCQYTHTELGQGDVKCFGCKHREESK
jgi:hypothetical protein